MGHVPADALAVQKVADDQRRQLNRQDAVAQGVERPAVVGALFIKEKENAAGNVPQYRCREEERQYCHKDDGAPEGLIAVCVLQDQGEEIGRHDRAHEDADKKVKAVEQHVEPQGHRDGADNGEHAQDVQQNGVQREQQAGLIHALTAGGRLFLSMGGEHQQHQYDDTEQFRRQGPPNHAVTSSALFKRKSYRVFYHEFWKMNRENPAFHEDRRCGE